jgi:hypothetical protein
MIRQGRHTSVKQSAIQSSSQILTAVKIPCLSWSLNVPCRVHNLPPLDIILSQLKPVRIKTLCFFMLRKSFLSYHPRGRSSSPSRDTIFLLFTSSRPVLGPTQTPIQWVPGFLSPGVKRPGCEADHSPPTSAVVKKTWIYTSTPPYAFIA